MNSAGTVLIDAENRCRFWSWWVVMWNGVGKYWWKKAQLHLLPDLWRDKSKTILISDTFIKPNAEYLLWFIWFLFLEQKITIKTIKNLFVQFHHDFISTHISVFAEKVDLFLPETEGPAESADRGAEITHHLRSADWPLSLSFSFRLTHTDECHNAG